MPAPSEAVSGRAGSRLACPRGIGMNASAGLTTPGRETRIAPMSDRTPDGQSIGEPAPATRPAETGPGVPGVDTNAASSNASVGPPPAGQPGAPLIDQLSAAVVSTARGVRGRWMFVGWTADRLPAAATALEQLSDPARQVLAAGRGARLEPRKVPFATLIPVTYVMTGSAIDFADTPGRRAEDQVGYTVLDALGQRRDIALGELAVLGAIVAAREPLQAVQSGTNLGLAVDTVPLYTLFTTLPGVRADTGLAVVFDPTIAGSTNGPAFRSFVRHTVGRLLVLDESQPAASRKGYLDVAGRRAGTPPTGGFLQTLVWMRKMGLMDFDDPWLQKMRATGRRNQGRFIRLMRALGMVEVSDELLDELSDPRPHYDVDPLELDQMIDMAAEMYEVARRHLGG